MKLNDARIDIMTKNTLKSEFSFEGKIIKYLLTNPLEKDKLESEKNELQVFLRNKFNEPLLHIDYELSTHTTTARPYTAKEKFDVMITKNPALAALKDKLGLDTDY